MRRASYQLGWAGQVTNNYKMLYVPAEIAAIVKTKLLVFAVEGVGHDPLPATGTLPLDLPGALKRYRPGTSQVFRVKPRDPRPAEAWTYVVEAARRIKVEPDQLYPLVRVSDDDDERREPSRAKVNVTAAPHRRRRPPGLRRCSP